MGFRDLVGLKDSTGPVRQLVSSLFHSSGITEGSRKRLRGVDEGSPVPGGVRRRPVWGTRYGRVVGDLYSSESDTCFLDFLDTGTVLVTPDYG